MKGYRVITLPLHYDDADLSDMLAEELKDNEEVHSVVCNEARIVVMAVREIEE